MFGDCCIPCLLLMLGATLSKGPGSACPPLRVVAGVAAARLVVLPLLGTGWLVLAKSTGTYAHRDQLQSMRPCTDVTDQSGSTIFASFYRQVQELSCSARN